MRRAAPRSRLPSIAVAAALTVTLAVRAAHAEDAKALAARSFQAGSEAYARKDLRAAARAFDDAYRIDPRGAAAYNAGLSWQGLGDRVRAADDYTRALEASDLGSAERADATGRLRALEAALGRLALASPDGTHLVLDDFELPGSAANLHLEPGRHTLRVRYAGGKAESRALLLRAGVEQSIDLTEPREAEPPGPLPPVPAHHHDEPVEQASPDHTAAWLVLGGAVVASGLAVTFYELGLAALNDFDKSGNRDASLRDKATNLRTATWVSWGLAGALAATGVVLYLNPPSTAPAKPTSGGASVALDGHGVTLRVTF
ncbi:MAG TPA: hypothetical protein VIF15_22055 [Polyangiaceae bacterium]